MTTQLLHAASWDTWTPARNDSVLIVGHQAQTAMLHLARSLADTHQVVFLSNHARAVGGGSLVASSPPESLAALRCAHEQLKERWRREYRAHEALLVAVDDLSTLLASTHQWWSHEADCDKPCPTTTYLAHILRRGPQVNIHLAIAAPTAADVSRFVDEISARIALGPLPRADLQALFPHDEIPALHPGHALHGDAHQPHPSPVAVAMHPPQPGHDLHPDLDPTRQGWDQIRHAATRQEP